MAEQHRSLLDHATPTRTLGKDCIWCYLKSKKGIVEGKILCLVLVDTLGTNFIGRIK